MTPEQAAIVAAARACIGTRFRLHGRTAGVCAGAGLDCVGLAGIAFGRDHLPGGYALRGGDPVRFAAAIAALGLRPAADAAPADLLLLAAGPHQYHLAIRTDRGFVHADAGLRRVTEVPGPPRWPVLGRWHAC